MDRTLIALLVAIGLAALTMPITEAAGNKHCTWHGTFPLCLPSCPSGKKKIEGTAKKCGDSRVKCCLWGSKYVCCPKDWEGNAANAMSIAKD